MCDSRDREFVVLRGATTGWCIGQVVGAESIWRGMHGKEVALRPVTLLWVENPQYAGELTLLAQCPAEFGSIDEAMEHLKAKGAFA